MTGLDPDRRQRLVATKLRAVLGRRLARDLTVVETWPVAGGAAAVVDGTGWVLMGADPLIGLGAAIVWAERLHARELCLLVEPGLLDDAASAGVLARRASLFPATIVRSLEGTEIGGELPPAGFGEATVPDPAAIEAARPLREAGAQIVVEHGEVTAEVRGLQVARVVEDVSRGWIIEMGVGRFDQYAYSMLEGTLRDLDESIPRVIATVAHHRAADAVPHPLNRLARERLLLETVLRAPGLVGVDALVPIEPILPRANLRDRCVALALGADDDGAVVVGATVGVDLDVVPTVADACLRHRTRSGDHNVRAVVVTPARDRYPALVMLAERTVESVQLVAVEGPWT